MQQQLTWSDIMMVLYRRRRLIARIGVGGTVAVAALVIGLGPSYRATATLMVTAERARSISTDAEALPTLDRVTDEDLNSQAMLLANRDLVRTVLTKFRGTPHEPSRGVVARLRAWPFEAVDRAYRALHGLPQVDDFERWVYATQRRLKIAPIKKTNLIEVSYKQRGIDPAWAATLVNAVVDEGLARHERVSQQSEAQEFFDEQQLLLNQRVVAAEAARSAFYAREGLDSVPEQRALWRSRLSELNMTLQVAESDLAVETTRVATLASELSRHPKVIARESRMAQNQAVQFIKPRILEKELERNQLLSTYKESSAKVRDVERELAEARALLEAEEAMVAEKTNAANPTYQTLELELAQAKTQAAAAQARVDALRAQIHDVRVALEHLDTVAAEQARLEQEVGVAKEAFATYAKKHEQARLSSALDASRLINVAVAQAAEVPAGPARAYRVTLLILGAVMSAAMGVGLAFIRDGIDPTLRSGADAELLTGAPLLAELPS
jgi:uncharacterized protein involved in exopolysaccharide biosynthesis